MNPAIPSHLYARLKKETDEKTLLRRFNYHGQHASPAWQPMHACHASLLGAEEPSISVRHP